MSKCFSCGWRNKDGCTNTPARYLECVGSGFVNFVQRKGPIIQPEDLFSFKNIEVELKRPEDDKPEDPVVKEINILRPMPGDIIVVHVDAGEDDGSSWYVEKIDIIQDRLQKRFPELKFLVAPMGFAKFEVIRPGQEVEP